MPKYIANEIINLERFLIAKGFDEYSFIYRNTNENINGYLTQIPVKDKDILTVASSGDHALLSLLNGAKSVETFDINHFAKYYQELKISGYQVLSYEDFINFFYTEKGFTYEIFEKINNLPLEIKDFWEYLFAYNDDYTIIDSQLFSNFEYDYDLLKQIHPFLDKQYFNEHKTKNNIPFFQNNALFLPNTLKKQYDIIMLSNIPSYIKDFHNIEIFKNYLIKLSYFLSENGLIIANYIYNFNNDNEYIKALLKTLPNNLQTYTFPSITKKCNDSVLVYKKN